MIRGFKHRGLKRLYDDGGARGIRPDLVDVVERILTLLDGATTPLASSEGRFKGLWSVTVRANWRVVFRFEGADVFDIELIDYH